MRIAAITTRDKDRQYTITLPTLRGPLTAIYGPVHSGKTAVADLVGHALFGRHRVAPPGHTAADGELIVEDRERRYRVRSIHDASGHTRLTVAALDGAPIDHHTIRKLVGNLPPAVLTPMCAVHFRETPDVTRLFSEAFATGYARLGNDQPLHSDRRAVELAARRDLLAQELETRIATERRASKDLEMRWRELDRLVREEQQQSAAAEQRLKTVEHALAETDSRLRYRRLELNVELRWQSSEAADTQRPLELEGEISRCRQVLAELSERESAVRAQLAQLQTARPSAATVLADQQTWLAVSRQLAADLSGEVARLARATASQQCVCRDAHPRLRPIAETIERQLAVLEKTVEEQRQANASVDFAAELDHLTRAQAELRRHLEHLLERNQAQLRGSALARQDASGTNTVFSAADAEQLENRRLELEQERYHLAEQLNSAVRKLKVLRAERDAIERERATLLSARSIEHVQREMAHVQKKLENAGSGSPIGDGGHSDECLTRASDFLAQLTSGDISRLSRLNHGLNEIVVNRRGETVGLELLSAAERDQVYLSVCLALLTTASQHDVWLPLVLDDPFERLDARAIAALAAVLEGFCREGHQVLVFTGRQDAAERLVAVGAEMHDIMKLRQLPGERGPVAVSTMSPQTSAARELRVKKRRGEESSPEVRRRKKRREASPANGEAPDAGHSDAA